MKRSTGLSAALTVGSQPAHSRNHNNTYTTERNTPKMATTLITPSITSLYGQTEIDPLDLTRLAGRHAKHINLDAAKHVYRDAVQEALNLFRPDWTLALDGSVTGPQDWQQLTPDEAEELAWEIDTIDTTTILQEATR